MLEESRQSVSVQTEQTLGNHFCNWMLTWHGSKEWHLHDLSKEKRGWINFTIVGLFYKLHDLRCETLRLWTRILFTLWACEPQNKFPNENSLENLLKQYSGHQLIPWCSWCLSNQQTNPLKVFCCSLSAQPIEKCATFGKVFQWKFCCLSYCLKAANESS